jgi:hypothetical protein
VAFKAFWDDAMGTKTAFDQRRENGMGKLARTANDFGSTAYDILQAFHPMVDVIKGFGPYGNMAIGTDAR